MAYGFKSTLTVDHTQCGATDSTSFPVLLLGTFNGTGSQPDLRVTGSGGKIQNTVSFNGQTVPADLKFTSDSAGSTLLSWEVAQYTSTTGAIEVWIKRDISASSDTLIYMFYGDSSVSTYQGGSVGAAWNSNFKGVWHLPDGTTLTAVDSTTNANNGTLNNTPTADTGQIDGGATFAAASSQSISVIDHSSLKPSTAGFSFWFKRNGNQSNGNRRIIEKGTDVLGQPFGSYFVQFQGGNPSGIQVLFGINGTAGGWTSGNVVNDLTWYKVDATYDGSNIRAYFNGALQTTVPNSGSISYDTNPLAFGASPDNAGGFGQFFNGTGDEYRVYDSIRTDDWFTAEYNNQKGSSTFLSVGNQTTIATGIIWTLAFV